MRIKPWIPLLLGAVLARCSCGGDDGPDGDTTPPVLAISPQNGATLPAGNVAVEITYSDTGSGVDLASLTITVDGADVKASFNVEPARASATIAIETAGAHTIAASIEDVAGNPANATSTFTITRVEDDRTPPTIAAASPQMGSCAGPTAMLRATFSDAESGIDAASFRARSAGTDLSSVFTLSAGEATAPAASLPPVIIDGAVSLSFTIADLAGNTSSATVSFNLDRTGPSLSITPNANIPADLPYEIVVSYGDTGCAGAIDLGSFHLEIDTRDATSEFMIANDRATSTQAAPSEGMHTILARISDVVGNVGSSTSTFSAFSPAVGLEIRIDPAMPNDVPLGAPQMVTVRAVSSSGQTALGFTGDVILFASDGNMDLDGRVLSFSPMEMGEISTPVIFSRQGDVIIGAESLLPAPNDFYVQLAINVVLVGPAIVPDLPAMTGDDGELLVEGYSFPGVPVEIVDAGTRSLATTVASLDGSFSVSLTLSPASYEISARARHPVANDLRESRRYTVVVPRARTLSLRIEPPTFALAYGQSAQIEVLRSLSSGAEDVVTSTASLSTTGGVMVNPRGLVTASAIGSGSVIATLDGVTATATVAIFAPILERSSPSHGEADVGLRRETHLWFSAPLDPTTVSEDAIHAEFAGQRLAATLRVSADQRRVTIFYADPLPGSARVRVSVRGDDLRALGAGMIDADDDGIAGGTGIIDFDTASLTAVPGTRVFGRVFASELVSVSGGSVNVPLAGVTISVDGAEGVYVATTDAMGNFRLDPSPSGRFFVHIDGRTATNGVPAGAYYPNVGKAWEAAPAEETNVGNIHLPLVEAGSLQPVSMTNDTPITFAPSVLGEFPELTGTVLTVPAQTLYDPNCPTNGSVGISPVDPERLPGELPKGLNFSLVITVQTDCASNFDRPVPVCFPNLEGLPPGAESALWSFNHDAGRWEVVGTMHVTQDGSQVCTDPGVGIQAPGWHSVQAGTNADGGNVRNGNPNDRNRPGSTGRQECSRNDCPCSGHCQTRNKVALHSGEEQLDRIDLSIPGRGEINFVMRRRYRSQLDYDGPLGHGWDFDYNEGLFRDPDGSMTRVNGKSHIDQWVRNADGSFSPPTGHFRTMIREADGSIVLRAANGFKRIYGPDGRLHAYQDRWNNVMLFFYDPSGNLDLIIDPFGREIDFEFQTFPDGKDRLVRVTDFMQRTVEYRYDSRYDLVEVRTPIVTGTPHGNDFPNGRVERYTYSSGFNDPVLNHNLLSVTAPEEVARGGPPRLQWTYGTSAADPVTYDRVTSETIGGTNASGVAAGGTQTYAYSMLNQGAPPNPDLPRGQVTITERNGRIVEYQTNERDHHIVTRVRSRGVRPGAPAMWESRYYYDAQGLVTRQVMPEGNEVRYTYDTANPNRALRENVLEVRRVAGPRGGGADLVERYGYEPLYGDRVSVIDPRGNTTWTPPMGTASAARYTTRMILDYQEGTQAVPEAVRFGISLTGVQRGLGDLNGDGRTDQSAGNIVRAVAPSVTLRAGSNEAQRLGSTTQPIIFDYAYNDRGQLVAEIDPEGNVIEHDYHPENDPDGDGTPVTSPFLALSSMPRGYKASTTIDARTSPRRRGTVPPSALVSRFSYDAVGNMTRSVSARGVANTVAYNSLNEPIVMTRGADVTDAVQNGQLVTGERPYAYRTRFHYDANGRRVKSEVENRDSTTAGVGEWIDTVTTYNILDHALSISAEVDAVTSNVTRYRYDANELPIELQFPEGNRITWSYDDRNLLYTTTRGAGSPEASTITIDYDLNGNPTRNTDAQDNDGDGQPETSISTYDGFDRLIRKADVLGNAIVLGYDPASNVVSQQFLGHPPAQPSGAAIRLAESRMLLDEMHRAFRTDRALFLASGFSPSRSPDLRDQDSDGWVTSLTEYDALGRVTHEIEDDGGTMRMSYDGVSREVGWVDADGNRVELTFDRGSNLVRRAVTEHASGGAVADQTFVERNVFDQLGRLVRSTDNFGLTQRYEYDSRDNLIRMADAEGPVMNDPLGLFPGMINGPGNTTTYVYDGRSRRLEQIVELRQGGRGDGRLDVTSLTNPDAQIRVRFRYDGNSRVVSMTDDSGNTTSSAFDALDREITKTMADGTMYRWTYDRDSNVVSTIDPNGTTVTWSYDALSRLVGTQVARGAGVIGATTESYAYDGLSRLVAASSEVMGQAEDSSTMTRVFDSLSRYIEESQNGRAVSRIFAGDGRRLALTYPGGRRIDFEYDGINRLTRAADGAQEVFRSRWIGPGYRPIDHRFGNGTVAQFLDGNGAPAYDAARRLLRQRHLANNVPFVDREYSYGRMSQRLSEVRHDEQDLTDRYTYDSAYRIVESRFDEGGAGTRRDRARVRYDLDGVGNRRQALVETPGGAMSTEAYSPNAVNAYASAFGASHRFDANGNLLEDDRRTYAYDFRNRLVEVRDRASGAVIAHYAYDAIDRRIAKRVMGGAPSSTQYLWDDWQTIEEQSAQGMTLATYVYGTDVDDLVQIARTAQAPGGAATLYVHRNSRRDAVAISGANGALVERTRYDDFGVPDRLTSSPVGFQGAWYDSETSLYYFRQRFYDPRTGRFLQRDPVNDPSNSGNQYTFAGNSPASRRDPYGASQQPADAPSGPGVSGWDVAGSGTDIISGVVDATGRAPGVFNRGTFLEPIGRFESAAQRAENLHDLAMARFAAQNGGSLAEIARTGEAARDAARAAANWEGAGLGLDFVLGAAQEATTSMNTSWYGAAGRVTAVGGINAAYGASPPGVIFQSLSSIVDNVHDLGKTYEWWDGFDRAPKLMDTINNAGRAVGVVNDVLVATFTSDTDCRGRPRHSGWRSVQNFVDNARNNQGSISASLVRTGEWWGDPLGDLWNWASGETARARELEHRRILANADRTINNAREARGEPPLPRNR
jgi:RHS repeat-associated protein